MQTDVLSRINHLSQIKKMKDVKSLSSVTFPGTHCPLFGAAMTIRLLKEAMMLVIGTEECTYYTKSLSLSYGEFGGVSGRCVSFVMDYHDVTFGCRKKLEETIENLAKEYQPKVIFLVTTCVPEMTGEDVDTVASLLSKRLALFLPVIHTDHFRCDGHLLGVQNAMKACIELMNEAPQERNGVNILGKNIANSELVELLHSANATINLVFPSHTSLAELQDATNAKVNIVCTKHALALAKEMSLRFGIPYITFFDRCQPDDIMEGYQLLFKQLEIKMPSAIEEKRQKLEEEIKQKASILEGGTYFYGNSSVDPFVINVFLSSLGMHPLLIQIKDYEKEDIALAETILKTSDPYVTRSANLASLHDVYGILKPDLYLGPAERNILLENRIIGLGLHHANEFIGFELASHIVDVFYEGMLKSKEIKKERIQGI